MKKMPCSPFTTRLSGSAKEAQLRIRNIFQWKKKRPPVIALIAAVLVVVLCGSLIGFTSTAQNGLLGQVYQEYFERNPSERITIAYENKENPGYPLLTARDSSFEAALQYLQVMELRTARGKNRYIGDFDSRDGAIILNGAGGQQLKIEMYPSAECLVISEGETAKVYRWDEWAKAFDLEQFLSLWTFKVGDDSEEESETSTETIAPDDRPDLGIPDTVDLTTADGKTYPAQRYDGDGWYVYIAEGWNKEATNSWDKWHSQYGTNAFLEVVTVNGGTEDIKAYYAELGAWPYDTELEEPFDSYYLLNPIDRKTLRREMFFIPVAEKASYAVECTVVMDTQREGEYELLHAMAASFRVDERVTRAPREGVSLAMRSVLKNLSWENTYGLSTGGAADHEIAMTREIMELFGSVADRLTSVDEPSKFSTILGGVTLWLSENKGERINFYPSEHYPDVLVNYVTGKGKEYASVEDVTLYSFLVAAVEKKYVELHDLDGDRSFETVQWDSENNKRFLVIYDVYDGQIQRVNVNEVLDCTGSDYSGQIGNIPREYSNLAVAYTDDGTFLYRYDGYGRFTYFCTLEEALAVENRVHPLTANDEVLAHLDRFFESNVTLRAFLISGSGPLAATVDEYRGAVREVFARYNWTKHEEKPTMPKLASADWTLYLRTDREMMELSTNSSCLTVRETTSKGTVEHYYSYYDAATGKLNTDLVALCDTPLFYYGMTMLPVSVGTGEVLAKAYEQKFKELLLNSGIVGDYELVSLESVSENGFEYIDLSYKVTPAHPDRFWCDSIEIDEDGRWTIQEGIILSKGGMAGKDEVWRLYGFAEEDMEWMKDHLRQLAQASQA